MYRARKAAASIKQSLCRSWGGKKRGYTEWDNRNQRENRWYTAARLNPIFSPPAICEIYRRDKASAPPPAYTRAFRSFPLVPLLANVAHRSAGGRSEWTIEAKRQDSTDLMRENLVWLTFECLRPPSIVRFTARHINDWLYLDVGRFHL